MNKFKVGDRVHVYHHWDKPTKGTVINFDGDRLGVRHESGADYIGFYHYKQCRKLKPKANFVVDIKMTPSNYQWEVSVIKSNYKHGFKSWGWGDGIKKIIVAEGGLDTSHILVFENAKKFASTLCDHLNKEVKDES